MSVTRCSHLAILFLAVSATLSAQTPITSAEAAPPSAHPKAVYPQIVRLSLVEGDVRVAVGKQKGLHDVAPWVQAVTNMPLESGFSVVTGNGRMEIEFEDASTMYVGEKSVLTFGELSTKNNVPYTEMTLLTGVATLHLHPTIADEMYLLQTPTDYIRVPYGKHANLRVNSYTDTTTITPLSFADTRPDETAPKQSLIGKTFTFRGEMLTPAPASAGNVDASFDAWVTKRVQARAETMHAVMKEANLSEPLPGLADMEAKGAFFACKPYGTCWAPTNGWGGAHAAAGSKAGAVPVSAQATPQTQQAPSQAQQAQDQARNAKLAQAAQNDEELAEQQTEGGDAPETWVEAEDVFPCSPYVLENLMGQDPVTGDTVELASDIVWKDELFDGYGYGFGYDWAVCHSGSWLYRRHRYVWVAGRQHHHRPPVHWVKMNGKLGYVPIHPHDAKGKEPENLRNGIFVPADRKGGGLERVAYDPGAHVKVLAETPKEFQQLSLPALHATSAPKVEAHSLLGGAGSKAIAPTSLIAFDSKARGFTVTTQTSEGGRSHTVVNHVGGGISGGVSRGFSGGSGGGGRAYGGGGGGRAGSSGGSSGGGGGSHSSGGGSVSSASSGSSGASSGGGGGSHH